VDYSFLDAGLLQTDQTRQTKEGPDLTMYYTDVPPQPMFEATCVSIKNKKGLRYMLNNLAAIPEDERTFGVDLDFVLPDKHGAQAREGVLCTMQINSYADDRRYLVDLLWMKDSKEDLMSNFMAKDKKTSLKTILESVSYTKLMWDCRQDSDCLSAHFGVSMTGVIDVQLMKILVDGSNDRMKFGTRSKTSFFTTERSSQSSKRTRSRRWSLASGKNVPALKCRKPMPMETSSH
jgi:hypothetical protein